MDTRTAASNYSGVHPFIVLIARSASARLAYALSSIIVLLLGFFSTMVVGARSSIALSQTSVRQTWRERHRSKLALSWQSPSFHFSARAWTLLLTLYTQSLPTSR